MKVVIAPDSFKGSLSAHDVCTVIKKAFSDLYTQARNIARIIKRFS